MKKRSIYNLFNNEIVQLLVTIAVYEFLKWYFIEFFTKLFR